MFIDYVTLLLANMAAGFLLLGFFLLKGQRGTDPRSWAAAFAVVALIALAAGFHMAFTWPLPGPYNFVFGELSVLLGAIYAGIALSLAAQWRLSPLAIFIVIASGIAIVLGAAIIKLGLTAAPLPTGAGFIISGLGGLLTAWAFCSGGNRAAQVLGAIVLFLAGALWAYTSCAGYWAHFGLFKDYRPATMRPPPPPPQEQP